MKVEGVCPRTGLTRTLGLAHRDHFRETEAGPPGAALGAVGVLCRLSVTAPRGHCGYSGMKQSEIKP